MQYLQLGMFASRPSPPPFETTGAYSSPMSIQDVGSCHTIPREPQPSVNSSHRLDNGQAASPVTDGESGNWIARFVRLCSGTRFQDLDRSSCRNRPGRTCAFCRRNRSISARSSRCAATWQRRNRQFWGQAALEVDRSKSRRPGLAPRSAFARLYFAIQMVGMQMSNGRDKPSPLNLPISQAA